MRIDDNWHIESDKWESTLVHTHITDVQEDGTGGNEKRTLLHYPTVKQCLKRYVQEEVKGCDSIDSILTRIDELESTIDNLNI